MPESKALRPPSLKNLKEGACWRGLAYVGKPVLVETQNTFTTGQKNQTLESHL